MLFLMLRSLWFWILACPIVSTVFASYLYLTVGFLGMHWNEGFSSLQHTGFKNFVRMRVTEKGELECYAVGLDKSPVKWRIDERHVKECAAAQENKEVRELLREMARGDHEDDEDDDDIAVKVGAHTWSRPSKWVEKHRRGVAGEEIGEKTAAKIVDHFVLS